MGVKLQLYQYEGQDIIIDMFQGKTWGDFVIVTFSSDLSHDDLSIIAENLQAAARRLNKQIILVPSHMVDKFEFYGVREPENDGDQVISRST